MSRALTYPADTPSDVRAAADTFRSAATATDVRRHAFSRASALLDTWQGPSARAAGQWFDQHTTTIASDVDGLVQIAATLDSYAVALDTSRSTVDAARAEDAALATARTALLSVLPTVRPGAFSLPAGVVSRARALRSAAAAARTAHDEAATAQHGLARAAEAVIDAFRAHAPEGEGTTRTPYPYTPGSESPDGMAYEYPGLGPMSAPGCYAVVEPAWPPIDAGAGAYASREPGWSDALTYGIVDAAATVMAARWPDASRNLRHYLGGSGRSLEQDVDRMLVDDPSFAARVAAQRTELIGAAVAAARAQGASGPVTFPVASGWTGHDLQDRNWYLASGATSYALSGQVTVAPPTTPDGAWTYEMSTTVSTYDRYNWDPGKSTNIDGIDVTDQQLASLHTSGLAQEYDLHGTSTAETSSGSAR